MNLRNIIELILFLISAAVLLRLYFRKRREVQDLDGFEIVTPGLDPHDPHEETIIVIEHEPQQKDPPAC